ncbi:S-layer homology domain-containing protein [Paenibacillus sp. LjRoot56]|uniref:S-layer homology domain-containing protein n=1 Tax=Paenibacillus sp. LjRoot56 TaxID=3342333 RepID=UPI003ECD6F03
MSNIKTSVVFKDVDNQSWSFRDISAATKLTIINGFEDGSFKPNDSVTRAEFTAMVVRAFGLSQGNDKTSLNDIKDSWAKNEIEILASNGIISGYDDNSYQPGRNISRAEMIIILSRIINLKELKSQSSKSFSDVKQNYWAKDSIEDATRAGIIQGSDFNTFSPDHQATRAESISVIMRVLKSIPEIQSLIVE